MRFGKKEKKIIEEGTPTLIGENSSFEGNFVGNDSICIDGNFKGYIKCKENVYINQNAFIEGDISGKNVVVHGKVIGNITAKDTLIIGEKGKIIGDVSTKIFAVEKGGVVHGRCNMEKEVQNIEKETRGHNFLEKLSILSSRRSSEIKEKINNLEKSIDAPTKGNNGLEFPIDDSDDVIEVKEVPEDSSNSVSQ